MGIRHRKGKRLLSLLLVLGIVLGALDFTALQVNAAQKNQDTGTRQAEQREPAIITLNAMGGTIASAVEGDEPDSRSWVRTGTGVYKRILNSYQRLPNPIAPCYSDQVKFDGWYDSMNYTNRIEDVFVESGSMTLYAKWIYLGVEGQNENMWYHYNNEEMENMVDVRGLDGERKIRTTFKDFGYGYYCKIGTPSKPLENINEILLNLPAQTGNSIFHKARPAYDIYIASLVTIDGTYATMHYIVVNTGDRDVENFSLGYAADIMIGNDDMAIASVQQGAQGNSTYIQMQEKGTNGKMFRLYVKGTSYGITDVDRLWLGLYDSNNYRRHAFDHNTTSTTGGDSAFACSWADRTIPANSSTIWSVKLGVGELSEMGDSSNTVTLDANGGVFRDGSEVSSHSGNSIPVGSLETPTRIGYKFDGWYLAREGGTKQTGNITESITLYAHWKEALYGLVNDTVVQSEGNQEVPKETADIAIHYGDTKVGRGETAAEIIRPGEELRLSLDVTEGYYLPKSIYVDIEDVEGTVHLTEGTGYQYVLNSDRTKAEIIVLPEYLTGDVVVTTIGHPVPAELPQSVEAIVGEGGHSAEISLGDELPVFHAVVTPEQLPEHTYRYQWYENSEPSNQNGGKIPGATEESYTFPAGRSLGEYYFYCIVTSERNNGQKAVQTSNYVKVHVKKAVRTVTLADKEAIATGEPIGVEEAEVTPEADKESITYVYYTDEACTQQTTADAPEAGGSGAAVAGGAPSAVGTYYVKAYVPEDDTYEAAQNMPAAKLTIMPKEHKVRIRVCLDGEDWESHGRTFGLADEKGNMITDLEKVQPGTYRIYDITKAYSGTEEILEAAEKRKESGVLRTSETPKAAEKRKESGTPEMVEKRKESGTPETVEKRKEPGISETVENPKETEKGIDTGIEVIVGDADTEAIVNYYTATFYDEGIPYGEETPQKPQIILSGQKAVQPEEPKALPGYVFEGWMTEADGNVKYDFSVSVEQKTDIYAKWSLVDLEYRVEHYLQNREGGYTLRDTERFTGTVGEEKTAAAKEYEGYQEDKGNEGRVPSGTVTAAAPLVLKLYYNPIEYQIHYDLDGGELPEGKSNPEIYTVISDNITLHNPQKEGYDFLGWTQEMRSTPLKQAVIPTGSMGDRMFKANWEILDLPYRVEHYLKNSAGGYTLKETEYLEGTFGEEQIAAAKEYEGFLEDVQNENRIPSGVVTADGTLVLRLYYNPVEYTISYELNGGRLPEGKTNPSVYTVISDEITLINPQRRDMLLPAGPQEVRNAPQKEAVIPTGSIGDRKFTANWEILELPYRIEHYLQDGSGGYILHETEYLQGTFGEEKTAKAKEYTGYLEDEENPDRISGGVIPADGTLVLKLYYALLEYPIRYHLDGGRLPGGRANPISYTVRSRTITLVNPVKEGYIFLGWTEQGSDSLMETVRIPSGSTGGRRYTAHWEARTDIPYWVEHYQENPSGDGYSLADRELLTGTTGAVVTAQAKEYIGYTENTAYRDRVGEGTVSAGTPLVLRFYYDRETYVITFVVDTSKADVHGKTVQILRHGQAIAKPFVIPRPGYVLNEQYDGWDREVPANAQGTATYTAQIAIGGKPVTEAEQVITETDTDTSDPEDSRFYPLMLRAYGKNKSIRLKWQRIKDADGYILYGSRCGSDMKRIRTIKNGKTTTCTMKNLKAGTYYKYLIVAYQNVEGKKRVTLSSKSAHAVTNGGKNGNPSDISCKPASFTLKKGKTRTLKPSYKETKKIKTHIAKFRFQSDNPKVASVNKKGKITGKAAGSCSIYVYAQNGHYKKVKVKVK